MKILWLEPVGGISGDMALSALLDVGASEAAVRSGLATLGLGFELRVSRSHKLGIHGTRVDVIPTAGEEHERSLADIRSLLAAAAIPEGARRLALAVFERLGDVEAKIHGTTTDQVHFHEVGAVDSIVDIVGTALALDGLAPDAVFAGPPPLGGGVARSRHGPIPLPAPATLELLLGRPVRSSGDGERTTPTGAAILAGLTRPGPPPALVPERVGYGIGHADFPDAANVLRATLARGEDHAAELVEVACNLDDATPQVLARALEALLEAGALDAWIAPLTMKKGRPGHLLSALAPAPLRERLGQVMIRETPTLGVRFHAVERDVLERRFEVIDTPFGPVRIKIGHRGDEVFSAAPEWDDCVGAGAKHGVPARKVREEALAAFLRKGR